MSPFISPYSARQRDAVVRRIVDDGLSAHRAIEEAASGALYDLPPFSVALSTAQGWARQAHHERYENHPETMGDELTRRLLLLHARDVAEIEREAKTGNVDHDRLLKAMKRDREAKVLAGRLGKTRPAETTLRDGGDPGEGVLERIARELEEDEERERFARGGG